MSPCHAVARLTVVAVNRHKMDVEQEGKFCGSRCSVTVVVGVP